MRASLWIHKATMYIKSEGFNHDRARTIAKQAFDNHYESNQDDYQEACDEELQSLRSTE